MLSFPLPLRLLIAFALVIGVSAITVGLLQSGRVRVDARQQAETVLRADTVLIAEVVRSVLRRWTEGGEDKSLHGELRRLSSRDGEGSVRYTVFDAAGVAVADSRLDTGRVGGLQRLPDSVLRKLANFGSSPSFRTAAGGHSGATARLQCTARVDDVVMHAGTAPRLLGFVRTSRPQDRAAERSAALRQNLLFGVLVGVLVAVGVSFWIARRFADPLRQIRGALVEMVGGDFTRRVEVAGEGAVGELARLCNQLGDRAGRTIDSLTDDRSRVVAMLEGMAEGVIATDDELRVLFVNDSARRMLGVEPDGEACVGQAIWEITRVASIAPILEAALDDDREIEEQIVLTGPAGDRTLELRASGLRRGASARGAVLVLHDVTELRRLEQVRRDFVANVSHELKTPITVIVAVVEMLLDDPAMDPEMRERFVRKLRDQADRLTALIVDQLTLARVEARGLSSERVRLDLRELVGAEVSLVEALADGEQVAISVEFPDVPAYVDGDAETLRQVANNLLGNAVAYTPSGGSVHVAIRADESSVTLEVTDTGVGLSTEDQHRVFERFYRVDRGRSRGGTGLGLSIVRNVVVAHGGQVSVRSELGRGSAFVVSLPRAKDGPVVDR